RTPGEGQSAAQPLHSADDDGPDQGPDAAVLRVQLCTRGAGMCPGIQWHGAWWLSLGQLRSVKALRLHRQHDIRLEEVAAPESPGADEVLAAPLRAGICGTALREYAGPGGAAPDEPHPLTGVTRPVILGHEFSARVIAVGERVSGTRVGDHVA